MALYSVSMVKGVRLDTDNGVVDVRTMFDDCGVLVVRVDSCIVRRLKLQKRVREGMPGCNTNSMRSSRAEPIELIGGKTGGEGCAIVSPIVERTLMFLAACQGVIVDIRCPVCMNPKPTELFNSIVEIELF